MPSGKGLRRHAQRGKIMKDETLLSDEVIESLEMLTSRNYFREWIKNPTGYVAGSIAVRDLVNVVLFADACRASIQSGNSAQPVTVPDDTRRMDWLVSKTVNVREPMVYGSHDLFWSQTISDDWEEEHKTTLREQIDAAMAAAPKAPDGWIPVSERMPENNSYVSVVSRHGEYVSGLVNGEWLELHDGSSFPVSEIYLWLTLPCLPSKPLPDAPKVTP